MNYKTSWWRPVLMRSGSPVINTCNKKMWNSLKLLLRTSIWQIFNKFYNHLDLNRWCCRYFGAACHVTTNIHWWHNEMLSCRNDATSKHPPASTTPRRIEGSSFSCNRCENRTGPRQSRWNAAIKKKISAIEWMQLQKGQKKGLFFYINFFLSIYS